MHRAETVVSDKKEREHELDHIRGAVKVNGNPDWRRVMIMRKSERLNKLLRKRKVQYHWYTTGGQLKTNNTLRQLLVRP